MSLPQTSRCPVCRARFRATAQCSRCGADLTPLMLLALSAWRLRNGARAALLAGDYAHAAHLAETAASRRESRTGRNLRTLARWLDETSHHGRRPV